MDEGLILSELHAHTLQGPVTHFCLDQTLLYNTSDTTSSSDSGSDDGAGRQSRWGKRGRNDRSDSAARARTAVDEAGDLIVRRRSKRSRSEQPAIAIRHCVEAVPVADVGLQVGTQCQGQAGGPDACRYTVLRVGSRAPKRLRPRQYSSCAAARMRPSAWMHSTVTVRRLHLPHKVCAGSTSVRCHSHATPHASPHALPRYGVAPACSVTGCCRPEAAAAVAAEAAEVVAAAAEMAAAVVAVVRVGGVRRQRFPAVLACEARW